MRWVGWSSIQQIEINVQETEKNSIELKDDEKITKKISI